MCGTLICNGGGSRVFSREDIDGRPLGAKDVVAGEEGAEDGNGETVEEGSEGVSSVASPRPRLKKGEC